MKRIVLGLAALAAITASVGLGRAQDADSFPDLAGVWRGEAVFLLAEGITEQTHVFVFKTLSDSLVTGEHSWAIPAHNLLSHDGKEYTFQAAEPFQGVIGSDGEIWLTEQGDTTFFRLHFIDENKLEIIALEGGDHSLVGRGVLVRE